MGFVGLDPMTRARFVSIEGYGIAAALAQIEASGPLTNARPESLQALARCQMNRPKSRLLQLTSSRAQAIESAMSARMRTLEYKKLDAEWRACMSRSGFSTGGELSVAFFIKIRTRYENIPTEEPARGAAINQLLKDEIPIAKADDRCRRATLDQIEPRVYSELRSRLFKSDPAVLKEARKVLA